MNHNDLIYKRYDDNDIFNTHPFYLKIKQLKTKLKKKEKPTAEMKKNNILFQQENKKFKDFLLETNNILIITYLIFLSVQRSSKL